MSSLNKLCVRIVLFQYVNGELLQGLSGSLFATQRCWRAKHLLVAGIGGNDVELHRREREDCPKPEGEDEC